jgi:uncharacterized protein YqjF (DUF2071 family)
MRVGKRAPVSAGLNPPHHWRALNTNLALSPTANRTDGKNIPQSLWSCCPARRSLRASMKARTFLTAEWRHLAMLNYAVDPSVLKRLVPLGTELDYYRGDTFVSVVGFRFLDTRVLGMAFPFHRDFEEVNLRFYVRRHVAEGWRRGVVFIRELVPRHAIAFVARACFGEPYTALPMRHKIEQTTDNFRVEYGWRRRGKWECVRAAATGQPKSIESGSLEEFITEHYWGYTAHGTACSEYQVEHPRWQVWHATEAILEADVSRLYGDAFVESLSSRPLSAFIADGSPVVVRHASEFSEEEPDKSTGADTGEDRSVTNSHRSLSHVGLRGT